MTTLHSCVAMYLNILQILAVTDVAMYVTINSPKKVQMLPREVL